MGVDANADGCGRGANGGTAPKLGPVGAEVKLGCSYIPHIG